MFRSFISAAGQKFAARKNTAETSRDARRAVINTLSTASLSPLSQYCAASTPEPMVSAAKKRFSTNCTCVAKDTAASDAWSSSPSISASEALTRALSRSCAAIGSTNADSFP